MMSRKRKITVTILILSVLLLVLGNWHKYTYSMYTIEPYVVHTANLNHKLLIATQGSKFKDAVTKRIVDYYKQDSIFIKVIDVSSLHETKPKNYNAILVMHTWENWKPPASVPLFLHSNQDYKDKIIVLTTSGRGSYKIKNIDAITGESKLEHVESHSEKIIERLTPLFTIK